MDKEKLIQICAEIDKLRERVAKLTLELMDVENEIDRLLGELKEP